MNKNNRIKTAVSTGIILLPVLIGLLLWNQLPDQMPVHWETDGIPDGWASKTFVIIGIPVCLALLQLLTVTFSKKQMEKQSEKIQNLVYGLIPVITLAMYSLIYAYTMGIKLNMSMLAYLFLGLILLISGNYLPKTKPNSMFGFRVPWVFKSRENWMLTNRLAGRLWVICGLVLIFFCWIPSSSPACSVMIFIPVTIAVIVPAVYSWRLYQSGKAA